MTSTRSTGINDVKRAATRQLIICRGSLPTFVLSLLCADNRASVSQQIYLLKHLCLFGQRERVWQRLSFKKPASSRGDLYIIPGNPPTTNEFPRALLHDFNTNKSPGRKFIDMKTLTRNHQQIYQNLMVYISFY